jgi:Mn2+/Fe2+ NRAMP family transporter
LKTSSFLGCFGVATGFAGMAASIFCTSSGVTALEQFVSSDKQQKAKSMI